MLMAGYLTNNSYISTAKDTQLIILVLQGSSEPYMENIPYDALLLKLHMDHWKPDLKLRMHISM